MRDADLPWDYPEPFFIAVQVQAADVDSFGHVNNSVYLRWLTECAWAHSAAVGLPEDRCVALRRGMAVRTINLDLLASAYAGEELLVGNWLTNKSRLRATRVYQIVNKDTEQVLLRGRVDFVCINLDNGRPTRMPPEFDVGYQETLTESDS